VTGDKFSEKLLLAECISSMLAQCGEDWVSNCSVQLSEHDILLQSENISDAKNRYSIQHEVLHIADQSNPNSPPGSS